ALVKSLKDEMEDNRADLLIKDAKGDSAVQESQVKDLIAQGIQALIVLPVDPKKAGPLVEVAHQAGIKVVSLESQIPDSPLDYLIDFNGFKAGELQAKAMVKKVPRGRYVLLGSDPNLRKGQMMALQPLIDKGDIRIVASRVSKGNAPEMAKEMMAILKAGGNKVDAVLAGNSQTAQGAAQALAQAGLAEKVPVAGVSGDLGTCQRIHSGAQALTVYDPLPKLAEEAAYLTAKVARNAKQFDCQFTEMPNETGTTLAVLLTPIVVDAKNLDSTIIQDGVQKREEVYGK
ncbi:MAG TPA: substrate-binding domain-containing protein, partial [bacterium]|nr:substrate-binding domain-containing protein [bacterium]